MPIKNRLFIAFLFFFALPSLLWAAPRVPEIVRQNGLVYCTHATGTSFNPQTADAGTSMNIVTEQIYNKLFEIKNNSSQVTPVLAESYEIADDHKIITLHLRKGVKFHHTPWFTPSRDFNADDVVFSLNRVLGHNTALPEFNSSPDENATNRQYQIFHELAKKARFPYFESIKLNQKIERVNALDPYTVEIRLFEPDSSVLSHLASQYAIIFSQEYALQLNADDNLAQLDLLPVGTGAYQIKDYFRNQNIRLVRNPHYWKKTPQIENIVIDLATDRTGRLAKFFNNECQIAAFPDVSQLGLLRSKGSYFKMSETDGMNLSFLAFNLKQPLMQDPQLRQAIARAIDRQRIIKDIYYQTATVANTIIPTASWAAVESAYFAYDYDPELAQQYFQDKQIELSLWVVNEEQVYNPSPIKMAELIKFDLAKVGVKVNIRLVNRNFLVQRLRQNQEDYDLVLSGWLAGNLDPDSFMRPILSCDAAQEISNLSNWCSESFDRILDRALISDNPNYRAADYHLAQRKVLDELPILPIANVKRVVIANPNISGVQMSAFGINFENLAFKKGRK